VKLHCFRFGDLGHLFDGPHATPTRQSQGPYFLNIASLVDGRLDLTQSDHVSSVDFVRWTKRVTPAGGDLLFSYETRLGDAALMPGGVEACLGRRMALLRPKRQVVDPRFLLYYYLSPDFRTIIDRYTIHGATVNRIGLSTMGSWPISIPDLNEQRAIAEVLGALDDKITANGSFMQATEDLLAARFAALRLDEEPGPDDDQVIRLDDLIEMNPKVPAPSESEPVYVDMQKLPVTGMSIAQWTHRPAKGGARFQNGDTLMARITPCLENRKTGYVDFLDEGQVAIGSTEYIVMRSRPGVPSGLSFFLAISDRFRAFGIRHMLGTTGRQRLSAGDLRDYRLRATDNVALESFGLASKPLLALVRSRTAETRTLIAMRDALLPQLMSGKIRVKDAEQMVGDVV
jgi:type I restriction enzyme S subunit